MKSVELRLIVGLAALLLAPGCGSSDTPELGYVDGTVTLDGKPLKGALVTFQPEAGRPSYARTDEEGWYELVYTDDNEGAMIGKHVVTITTVLGGDEDAGVASVPEKVPAKYNVESTLTADVQAGSQTKDWKLNSEGEIIEFSDAE